MHYGQQCRAAREGGYVKPDQQQKNLQQPILVMAGGTGGHVFPALAVAQCLRESGEQIIWLGTRAGIEARVVPAASFAIEWLNVQGLRGKGMATLLLAPFRLMRACWQALRILRRTRPKAVLGMGGFVAGPGGLMARLLNIPLFLHEQNSVVGLTNKILAKFATTVLQAFPAVFKHAITTGNPVRRSICEISKPETRNAQRRFNNQAQENLRLLIIGGSLGAVKLNEIIPQALANIENSQRPQVIHQTGMKNIESAKKCVDCHKDAHEPNLDKKYYPEAACNSCHNSKQWSEISFDHASTGYTLEGAHERQSCRSCHFKPGEMGQVVQQFSDLNSSCTNCHKDEHQSQFGDPEGTSCLRCHDYFDWSAGLFDHDQTAFPLDGKHKDVDCNKCHTPLVTAQLTYTRYKLKSFTCESCH